MNEIAVRGRPFPPGISGNPNGRPVGSRTAFSAAFMRDLAETWAEHGKDTMLHTAKLNPEIFFATCARLIPKDVQLTVQQHYSALDESKAYDASKLIDAARDIQTRVENEQTTD